MGHCATDLVELKDTDSTKLFILRTKIKQLHMGVHPLELLADSSCRA